MMTDIYLHTPENFAYTYNICCHFNLWCCFSKAWWPGTVHDWLFVVVGMCTCFCQFIPTNLIVL